MCFCCFLFIFVEKNFIRKGVGAQSRGRGAEREMLVESMAADFIFPAMELDYGREGMESERNGSGLGIISLCLHSGSRTWEPFQSIYSCDPPKKTSMFSITTAAVVMI